MKTRTCAQILSCAAVILFALPVAGQSVRPPGVPEGLNFVVVHPAVTIAFFVLWRRARKEAFKIAELFDGKLVIMDPKAWQRFLDKAPSALLDPTIP